MIFLSIANLSQEHKLIDMQVWRNWQTRMVQVHMKAISCRFKSCYLHQTKIIRTKSSLWETGSDYLFISTDTKAPTFRMALSSVPNPNRERRKSAIREAGKAATIIGELPCLLLCYSASCGAFTLFAFSICCAFHSANSRCPSCSHRNREYRGKCTAL